MLLRPPRSTLTDTPFPATPLFRSRQALEHHDRRVRLHGEARDLAVDHVGGEPVGTGRVLPQEGRDLAPLLRRTARAQREGRRARAVLFRHHLERQIGRAWWRESWCPSGSISVLAQNINKKK